MANDPIKKTAGSDKDKQTIHKASNSKVTPIHDTAGGEMPDANAPKDGSAKKDAKFAFTPKKK